MIITENRRAFVCSPFVDGIPSVSRKAWAVLPPSTVCCPPSDGLEARAETAVCIRLFVAPFVDGLPSPGRLESPCYGSLPSAIRGLFTVHRPSRRCRPPSPFVYSFPYSLMVTSTVHRPIALCRSPSVV